MSYQEDVRACLCGRPSVWRTRYPVRHLCKECFLRRMRKKIQRAVPRSLVGGQIGIAVSGGKDSSVLVIMLWELKKKLKISLKLLTVDEGITTYSERNVGAVLRLGQKLGLPVFVKSFVEIYGHTLDTLAAKGKKSLGFNPCTVCAILKRQVICSLAKEANLNIVASGHNLNDEAQTVVMNVLRGDLRRAFKRDHNVDPLRITRIKPLSRISEVETNLAYRLLFRDSQTPSCSYSRKSRRVDVAKFLSEEEERRPGTLQAITRSPNIAELLNENSQKWKIQSCEICGNPSPRSPCTSCSLVKWLMKQKTLNRA